MEKFKHFLKVFGLTLLAGLLGGTIHLAVHYWLEYLFGIVFIAVGIVAVYFNFTKKQERHWGDIIIAVATCTASVAITQFFDVMLVYTPFLTDTNEGAFQKALIMYQAGSFSLNESGNTSAVLSKVSILSDFIVYEILTLIVMFLLGFIMWLIIRKKGEASDSKNNRKRLR